MFIVMILLASQDLKENNFSIIMKYGTLVTIVGGIVGAFIMKTSKKLADKSLPASLVVSLRFYGLLILSFLMILFSKISFNIQLNVLAELLALALLSMAFPLFLLQKALKYLNALYVSIIITVIPVLTYLIQLTTSYYDFSIFKLILTIIFSLTLLSLTYLKKNSKT